MNQMRYGLSWIALLCLTSSCTINWTIFPQHEILNVREYAYIFEPS